MLQRHPKRKEVKIDTTGTRRGKAAQNLLYLMERENSGRLWRVLLRRINCGTFWRSILFSLFGADSADKLAIRNILASVAWDVIFVDERDSPRGVFNAPANAVGQAAKFVGR